MRGRLLLTIGCTIGLLAVGLTALAFGATKKASNGNSETFDLITSPTKLSATKPTLVSLKLLGNASSSNNIVPVPSTKEVFDFDKSVAVQAKGLPVCQASKLQGATSDEALAACGKSQIGSGNATAMLPLDTEALPAPGKVLIFNGPVKNGMPTVLLHSRAEKPAPQTLVLTGTFSKYNKQGYGLRLTIPIPPLVGGAAALTKSMSNFNRRYTYKGQKLSFFSARCTSGKLKYRATYTYQDGQTLAVPITHSCTKGK